MLGAGSRVVSLWGSSRVQQENGGIQTAIPLPSSSMSSILGNERHHSCLSALSFCYGEQKENRHRLCAHPQQQVELQQQQDLHQKRAILKQQQDAILESILQHQASLQQSGLLAEIEPTASGYRPPGFDPSLCSTVFVGHVHRKVSEAFLSQIFSIVGPIASCKLYRRQKSSFGFVTYLDQRSAVAAISTLNGRNLFNLPIRVNWAYGSDLRGETDLHTIFIGDVSSEVTDAALFELFSCYPSCSVARVMYDPRTGRSRGFGFVSFGDKQDAAKAIEEMAGKVIGSKAIRCNWAIDFETSSELTAPGEAAGKAKLKRGPENDSRYTTVFVGNLAAEVTQEELQQEFERLEVGVIKNVRVYTAKGIGFVQYSAHDEAARAIEAANLKIIKGKPVQCSWGYKRDPISKPSVSLLPSSVPTAGPRQSIE